jgi:hypothetical protein
MGTVGGNNSFFRFLHPLNAPSHFEVLLRFQFLCCCFNSFISFICFTEAGKRTNTGIAGFKVHFYGVKGSLLWGERFTFMG